MATNKDALRIIGIYLSAFLLLALVGVFIVPLFEEALENDTFNTTFNAVTNFIVYGLLTLSFILLFKKLFKHDIELSLEDSGETVKYILLGFGLMIVFVVLNGLLYELINVTETPNNQEAINSLLNNGRIIDLVLLTIFTVLFAPVVEEMVFRKSLQTFFTSVPLLGIIMSGFMFGFIHVTSGDYIQIIYYMTLGFVLAYFYYKSNYNIIVAIVMHMIFNGFLMTMMFLSL